MSTRTRQSTIRIIPAADDEHATAPEPLPILATSLFCDDVRMEATGKLMLIGCYPGNIIVVNPAQPLDRLWVFTKILWPRDFDPAGLRMRIDLPAQQPGYMPVQTMAPAHADMMPSATCVWQLRILPLRVGDVLRVGVELGGRVAHSGELLAVAQPSPPPATRH
jgi:hypothetical protein